MQVNLSVYIMIYMNIKKFIYMHVYYKNSYFQLEMSSSSISSSDVKSGSLTCDKHLLQ